MLVRSKLRVQLLHLLTELPSSDGDSYETWANHKIYELTIEMEIGEETANNRDR